VANQYFSEFIYTKPTTIRTSCGEQKTKFEALIPAFELFSSDKKIIFTLFDFHNFFDGLISFRDLKRLGFNWNIQEMFLYRDNIKIPVHQCSPSEYYLFNITVNDYEVYRTKLPVDVPSDGVYYIPGTKLNDHCYLRGCITNVHNKLATVEIHNTSSQDTYVCMTSPLQAHPIEHFEIYNTHFQSPAVYMNKENIKDKLRLDHLNTEERTGLLKICEENYSVFHFSDMPLSSTTETTHQIITTDETPIHTKSYRLPQVHREEVHKQIQKMLEDGIIRNSTSPWSSPVWIVPKKMDASGEKKWRLVIDYRKLNAKTIQDRYPIPYMEELLNKLGKSHYFTTLDLASSFHQIRMHKDSIAKTTFSTDQGHYEYLRMSFGPKKTPLPHFND